MSSGDYLRNQLEEGREQLEDLQKENRGLIDDLNKAEDELDKFTLEDDYKEIFIKSTPLKMQVQAILLSKERYDKIIDELQQAKDMLRKCSPIQLEPFWDGIEWEDLENCIACAGWKINGRHDEECPYIKMIGGVE